MATNVTQFNLAMKKAAKRLPEQQVLKFHKAIHMRALRGVVFKTPVDTGRLRANWQTSIGHISVLEFDTGKRGVKGKKGVTNAGVFAKAIQILTGLKPFGVSFIFNNVTYAIYVEEGTPKTKAHHMVQRTLTELQGVLAA